MAQNFGSNFLRGFQPNFANMFGTSYRMAGVQDERERQRQEALKAQQEQQGIMQQFMRGTQSQIVPPKMNAQGTGFENQSQDLTPEQKFGLYSKMTPANQNAVEYWLKQNAPKQQKTVTVGNDVFLESSQYENVPTGDKLYSKPEEIKPDFIETDYVGN